MINRDGVDTPFQLYNCILNKISTSHSLIQLGISDHTCRNLDKVIIISDTTFMNITSVYGIIDLNQCWPIEVFFNNTKILPRLLK